MFSAARSLPLTRSVAGRRLFHASAPVLVKVGDKLPDIDLVEGSPGNKVNLAKELTGKGIIIGLLYESNMQSNSDCCLRRSRCLLTFVLREPYPWLCQLAEAQRRRQGLRGLCE
jgi:hypothetical protein